MPRERAVGAKAVAGEYRASRSAATHKESIGAAAAEVRHYVTKAFIFSPRARRRTREFHSQGLCVTGRGMRGMRCNPLFPPTMHGCINPLLSNVLPARRPRGRRWPGWRGSKRLLLIESGLVLSFLPCLKQCKNVSTPKMKWLVQFVSEGAYVASSVLSLALSLSLCTPRVAMCGIICTLVEPVFR